MAFPGERIIEQRKALGWSQAQLAEKLGIHQNQISRYETGSTSPTFQVLGKLAKLFDTTTDYLLGLTHNKSPFPPQLSSPQAEMLQLMSTQSESAQAKFVEVVRLLVALRDEDA